MARSLVSSATQETTVAPDATLRVYPEPRPLLDGERIEAYFHPEFCWWGLIGRDELVGDTVRHVPSGEIWDKMTLQLFTGWSTQKLKQEGPHVHGRITVDPTKTRYAREGKLKASGTRMPPTPICVQKRTFLEDWAKNVQLIEREGDEKHTDPAKDRDKPSATRWDAHMPDHDPYRKQRR